MSQTTFKILINIPVILLTFMLGFYLPELSPKDMLFGVKISSKEKLHLAYESIIRSYKRLYIIICGSYSVLFIVAFYLIGTYYLLLTGLILLIILMQIVQYLMYKKAKQLNIYENLNKIDSNYIIIDKRSKKTQSLSLSWFLIPGLIAILSTVAGTSVYQVAPNFLPSGLFITGNDTHFVKKSICIIVIPFLFQLAALLAAYVIYIKISKFNFADNSINIEILEQKNMVFRYTWSVFTLILCTLIETLIFCIELRLFSIINFKALILVTLLVFLITVALLIYAVRLTRSSSQSKIITRLINYPEKAISSSLIDRADDTYWILGSFYFNPNDPSTWIRGRSGRGINFNFGRPITWLVLSFPVTLILIVLIYLFINKI